MDSRSKILNALKANQRGGMPPVIPAFASDSSSVTERFEEVLQSIGGAVLEMQDHESLRRYIETEYAASARVISVIPGLHLEEDIRQDQPHDFKHVTLTIIQAEFAVAENGAVWVTDASLPDRVLPFISEHLIAVVDRNEIVGTLHDAYERIGNSGYAFATFIAGPSKTADIEQALVLGAHGPKSMTVVLI